MRTLKAFLFAPVWSVAVLYVWTIAHFGMPHSLMALINPVVWLFALVVALPACYASEFALAWPIHYLLERSGRKGRVPYVISGAAVGAAACWIWAALVRAGPLPLHRDVMAMIMIGAVAGGIGGFAFWRMAVGGSDGTRAIEADAGR